MAAILVVEDDAATRETMRTALEEVGYTVAEAAEGQSGLDLLCAAPEPLVVLLDHLMPVLNGEGLLERVAVGGHELRRHAYVLMTGAAERLSPRLEVLLGALGVPVVAKPFGIDALLAAVSAAQRRLASER